MAVAAGRVKVWRERHTTIMTVTDCVEMGNAAKVLLRWLGWHLRKLAELRYGLFGGRLLAWNLLA